MREGKPCICPIWKKGNLKRTSTSMLELQPTRWQKMTKGFENVPFQIKGARLSVTKDGNNDYNILIQSKRMVEQSQEIDVSSFDNCSFFKGSYSIVKHQKFEIACPKNYSFESWTNAF